MLLLKDPPPSIPLRLSLCLSLSLSLLLSLSPSLALCLSLSLSLSPPCSSLRDWGQGVMNVHKQSQTVLCIQESRQTLSSSRYERRANPLQLNYAVPQLRRCSCTSPRHFELSEKLRLSVFGVVEVLHVQTFFMLLRRFVVLIPYLHPHPQYAGIPPTAPRQGRQVHDQSDQNERKRRRLTVGDAPGKNGAPLWISGRCPCPACDP